MGGETLQIITSSFCCVYNKGQHLLSVRLSPFLLLCLSSCLFPHPLREQQSLRFWFHYTVCFSPWRLRVISVIDGHSAQSQGTDRDRAEQSRTAHCFNMTSLIRTGVVVEPLGARY